MKIDKTDKYKSEGERFFFIFAFVTLMTKNMHWLVENCTKLKSCVKQLTGQCLLVYTRRRKQKKFTQ